jgi:DNA polymerase-1
LRVVIDIEANGLENVTKIWCVVCKDIDTGKLYIFRETDHEAFKIFSEGVTLWIGHNILGYDWPVLVSVWGCTHPDVTNVIDTLICSKLADYPRDGHSIEQYGLEFGYPKIDFSDFSKYTPEMEEYCVRDVEICHKIYTKYLKYISNPDFRDAIVLEHKFQLIVNDLHNNGFAFDSARATKLLEKVTLELSKLDKDI